MRERAEERLDGSAFLIDLVSELNALASEVDAPPVSGHRQIATYKGHGTTLALFAFEPGGGMREHAAPGVVTIHVLIGNLEINVASETHHVGANCVLVIPPGVRHDVKALEYSQMLLNVSLTKP